MTTAKIIFSYDCESKWGMLDHLDGLSPSDFSRSSILSTYDNLYNLHDEFDVAATFAFVGGFTLPKDVFSKYLAENIILDGHLEKWIANIDINSSYFDEGEWFYPDLIPKLKICNFNYEIATHGFSHAILSECSKDELKFEADGIKVWAAHHNVDVSTLIFPRNASNSLFFEHAKFLKAFRSASKNPFKNRVLAQFFRLFKELFIPPKAGSIERLETGVLSISGDFFINWRNGGRKIIPVGVSYRRAKKVIDDAIATGGVVNFWLHPHNLITGDRQFDLLRMIVEYVSKLDKEGMIESCTQKDLLISGP